MSLTTFHTLLTNLGIKHTGAFNLNFTIKARAFDDVTVRHTTVAGVEIPLIGALLVREKLLLEAYLASVNVKRTNFRTALEKLAYKLNEDLQVQSMLAARGLIAGIDLIEKDLVTEVEGKSRNVKEYATELEASHAFLQWSVENQEAVREVLDIFTEAYSETQTESIIVTIFLSSRTNGDWQYDDTFSLTDTEIKKVHTLYIEEAGINVAEEAVEKETEPDKVENLGNA